MGEFPSHRLSVRPFSLPCGAGRAPEGHRRAKKYLEGLQVPSDGFREGQRDRQKALEGLRRLWRTSKRLQSVNRMDNLVITLGGCPKGYPPLKGRRPALNNQIEQQGKGIADHY